MDFTYLDPETLILEKAPDDTLRAVVANDRCGMRIEVMRAFPLSHPEEQIVLRDGAGQEIGVLERLADLPAGPAALLREQLSRRYFLPVVTAIYSITEHFGSSTWDVETDKGRRRVSTKQMKESVFEVEPGRYLITDVEENRYEIKKFSALDAESRERFLGKT